MLHSGLVRLAKLLVGLNGEAELMTKAAPFAGGGAEPEAPEQAEQAGLGLSGHAMEQAAHPELLQVGAHRTAVELLERGGEVVGIQLQPVAHALQGDAFLDLLIQPGGGR